MYTWSLNSCVCLKYILKGKTHLVDRLWVSWPVWTFPDSSYEKYFFVVCLVSKVSFKVSRDLKITLRQVNLEYFMLIYLLIRVVYSNKLKNHNIALFLLETFAIWALNTFLFRTTTILPTGFKLQNSNVSVSHYGIPFIASGNI